ncbi:c-type cytochrome [Rhodopirellula halodulae]|uniref:c-type cytochrome n=1 Tax=Rhodopirellula halodulae TaxID=2894198 RepID=UPI001E330DA6|nr:c-type cytochrome [Rhodopirellula sp. JC737]MCC9658386.1 c-type cytochrome [Rhodopirellula sp. JC737]
MKLTWRAVFAGLILVAIVGGIVLVSGVVPIKASSGHWAITRALLDFASDRSVAFHSRDGEPPDDSTARDSRLGREVFRTNCKFCHGWPGEPIPPVAAGMTPKPPVLGSEVLKKEPRELFHIIQHGIKFAGMPAWPVRQRPDEVWPVVAFLREQNSEQVRDEEALHRSHDSAPNRVAGLDACAACHGEDGFSRVGSQVPTLAGQSREYLVAALTDYREGKRSSGIMMPIAHQLDDRQINSLAFHYANANMVIPSAAESQTTVKDVDAEAIQRGKRLAERGDGTRKIAACSECHDRDATSHHSSYPRLAGQGAWYLRKQLELFGEQTRSQTERGQRMSEIAKSLTARDRSDLAAYYASLTWRPEE